MVDTRLKQLFQNKNRLKLEFTDEQNQFQSLKSNEQMNEFVAMKNYDQKMWLYMDDYVLSYNCLDDEQDMDENDYHMCYQLIEDELHQSVYQLSLLEHRLVHEM